MTVSDGAGLVAVPSLMSLGSRPFAVEILEETCAVVANARLLGFCRAACLTGPEQGLVLVRSIWRAEVELMPWDPWFEIAHRRVVPAGELLSHLSMEEEFEPIYYRALTEGTVDIEMLWAPANAALEPIPGCGCRPA